MASEAWPADPLARWSPPANSAALLSAFEAQGVRHIWSSNFKSF